MDRTLSFPPFPCYPLPYSSTMQHVDPKVIDTNLQARVDYLVKFIEFGPKDAAALHGAAPIVKGLINGAVDAVCEWL
jgi:hypothetical protein